MSNASCFRQQFSIIGDDILNAWRDKSYKETEFPEIAYQALIENELHHKIDLEILTRWIMSAVNLPRQLYINSKFGDYRLTLFNCDRFYIEILLWIDGTTTIHQHGFNGAFSVIKGSSIHSLYEFKATDEINQSLLFGNVSLTSMERLKEGDVRKIYPGARTAHSLFHLANPNISIVIRTHRDTLAQQQLNYLKPHIAIDPFVNNELLKRQSDLINILHKINKDTFIKTFLESVSCLDLHSHIMLIINNAEILNEDNHLELVLSQFKDRSPELVDKLEKTIRHLCLNRTIVSMRQSVKNEELRFFLAVLLNAPDKKMSEELIAHQYPDRNVNELICHWLYELTNSSVVNNNAISDESLPFIKLLLEGLSFEEIIQNLTVEYDEAELLENMDTLKDLYEHFHNRSILSCLFK